LKFSKTFLLLIIPVFVFITCGNITSSSDCTTTTTTSIAPINNGSGYLMTWWTMYINYENASPTKFIRGNSANGFFANCDWESDWQTSQNIFEFGDVQCLKLDPEEFSDKTVTANDLDDTAKIYRRNTLLGPQVNDVTYDGINVIIDMSDPTYDVNLENSKVSVICTHRPGNWGGDPDNDYKYIVDALPTTNRSFINPGSISIDSTTDEDLQMLYIVDSWLTVGTTEAVTTGAVGDWFESMTVNPQTKKITIKIPKLVDGNTANSWWTGDGRNNVQMWFLVNIAENQ